jgi:glucokinase
MARALIADIGGTNTRVALAEGGAILSGTVRHYRNADFPALEPVLQRYLQEAGAGRPAAACLAMAGPVREGKGHLTNLDWTLDTRVLAEATGAETVALLNDLQAQGHALGHIPSEALDPIVPGKPPHLKAAQLVIGIGTGFNAAPVYNTAGGRYVPPAEAGHTSLPARTEADLRLVRHIESREGFASIEDALSGRGICTIHDWLAAEAGAPGGATSREIMEGLAAGEPRAREAATVFARLFGRVAGDLALTLLPFGGVFLIGGMARAMAPWLAELGFVGAFRDKGRFAEFMEQFAVTVVSDDDAALTGCALHLHALIQRG